MVIDCMHVFVGKACCACGEAWRVWKLLQQHCQRQMCADTCACPAFILAADSGLSIGGSTVALPAAHCDSAMHFFGMSIVAVRRGASGRECFVCRECAATFEDQPFCIAQEPMSPHASVHTAYGTMLWVVSRPLLATPCHTATLVDAPLLGNPSGAAVRWGASPVSLTAVCIWAAEAAAAAPCSDCTGVGQKSGAANYVHGDLLPPLPLLDLLVCLGCVAAAVRILRMVGRVGL
jgi:hypothetical protein